MTSGGLDGGAILQPSHSNDTAPAPDAAVADAAEACGAGDAGCAPGSYTTRVVSEIYAGECESAGVVQWGFLTYEATTPGDSDIDFRLRTAPTRAGLSGASWTPLITAQASPNTQVCGFAGPLPCPIDLYEVLGGPPRAHHAYAELGVSLHPTADGSEMPSVQAWHLNYSCALGT